MDITFNRLFETYKLTFEPGLNFPLLIEIIVKYKNKGQSPESHFKDKYELERYFDSLHVKVIDIVIAVGTWDLNFKLMNGFRTTVEHENELKTFNHLIDFLKILYPVSPPQRDSGRRRSKKKYKKKYKKRTKRRSKT